MKPSWLRKIKHCFLPHSETHQKAHLLSRHFLIIYILLFILLQTSFKLVGLVKPGVLGTNSNISTQKIIEEVNIERQKKGLAPLVENSSLKLAAAAKASNMFEENYWAHFSPSGKDPWGFITKSGYKFVYAGENLARNFYNSEDVVVTWMNSPSHRDNILNANYQDIGVVAVEGVLQGQKTTLIVQMFGRSYGATAQAPQININGQQIVLPESELVAKEPLLAANSFAEKVILPQAYVDPFSITKMVAMGLIGFVAILIVIDLIVLKRRGVFQLSSHHIAHLGFLAATSLSVFVSRAGEIL